jgi:hypothetical protein
VVLPSAIIPASGGGACGADRVGVYVVGHQPTVTLLAVDIAADEAIALEGSAEDALLHRLGIGPK